MADTESILSTLKMYYSMAKDVNKASLLIKDQAIVQFLVYLLMEDNNPKITTMILKILSLLSQKLELGQELKKVYGVLQALVAFISSCKDEKLKQFATEIHNHLMNPIPKKKCLCPQEKPFTEVLKERQINNFQTPKPNRRRQSCGRPRFLVSANKKAKITILQVSGIEEVETRLQCEDLLLQVRGVISFTFDPPASRVTIRTKADLDAQVLIQALKADSDLDPLLVAHDEDGNEVLLNESCIQGKENAQELPDYLPEVDSPAKDNAVINPNYFKKTSGWINSATNFLSKSFYW